MKWHHHTTKGPVFIVQIKDRFHVIFDDEDLGNYVTPQQASDDISGGHTFMPSSGIDLGELEISDDLGDWTRSK